MQEGGFLIWVTFRGEVMTYNPTTRVRFPVNGGSAGAVRRGLRLRIDRRDLWGWDRTITI